MEQYARTGLSPEVATLLASKGAFYAQHRESNLTIYLLFLRLPASVLDGPTDAARTMRRVRSYIWLERAVAFLDETPQVKADRLADALLYPERFLDGWTPNHLELVIEGYERKGELYTPPPIQTT